MPEIGNPPAARAALITRFQILWREYCPLRDAAECRAERLKWLSAHFQRAVASANELREQELADAISTLTRARPATRDSRPATMSEAQLWKIRQLERWLGWHTEPQRLAGLVRDKFRARAGCIADLTPRDAWRLIEMLVSIAARERARAELGHAPSPAEFRTARAKLKVELRSWRPAKEDAPF